MSKSSGAFKFVIASLNSINSLPKAFRPTNNPSCFSGISTPEVIFTGLFDDISIARFD